MAPRRDQNTRSRRHRRYARGSSVQTSSGRRYGGVAAAQSAGKVHDPHAVALRPLEVNAAPLHVHCSPRTPQEQIRQMAASERAAVVHAASSNSPAKKALVVLERWKGPEAGAPIGCTFWPSSFPLRNSTLVVAVRRMPTCAHVLKATVSVLV